MLQILNHLVAEPYHHLYPDPDLVSDPDLDLDLAFHPFPHGMAKLAQLTTVVLIVLTYDDGITETVSRDKFVRNFFHQSYTSGLTRGTL